MYGTLLLFPYVTPKCLVVLLGDQSKKCYFFIDLVHNKYELKIVTLNGVGLIFFTENSYSQLSRPAISKYNDNAVFESTIENPVIAVGCLLAVGGAGPNPAVDMREAVPPLYADVGRMVPLLH